ncbi:hypothetical protein KVV02_006964 [Mortierella alpina]|uniref:Endonuclease/exonuclease/phosphatase domain-containing protein n=1 Tax=Mortierella alpina TaxID=64518 RepID=A0A9P8A7F0_MORAP|nr:hypothetical protein KVV02_006964 [Mortierella alpina]
MKDARFTPYTSSATSSPSSSTSTSRSTSTSTSSSSSAPPSSVSTSASTSVSTGVVTSTPKQTIMHRVLTLMLESVPQYRGWEILSKQEASLSVLRYNLLSHTLATTGGRFHKDLHVPNPLHWPTRMAILLDEIAAMDTDIVCVQELDEVHYHNDFGTRMDGLGYKGVYSKRQSRFAHGIAMFYRISRVMVIKALSVPCPKKPILRGIEQAGLLLVLDVVNERKVQRVCVATTHIVCSHDRGFKKIGQVLAIISAAKAVMRKDPSMPLIFTGDMNAQAGSLVTEFVARGSVDLSSMPEAEFSRRPVGRRMRAVDQQHLEQVKEFKKQTWELRDLASPKPLELPRPRCTQNWTLNPEDLAAPVVSTFAPKVDELRHMARTYKDMENDVVGHPLHMFSVYGAPNIPDFIFYGQLMGCSPRLELVARLELPRMLLELKAALPAAYLGSDHLAIGAKYRFKD